MLGSPIYMAPEVLKGETYNRKADIWSLGVVLFQMIFGKCPFESKSIAKLIKLLDEEELIFPESPKISTTIRDLLKRMLVKDHTARIDWPDIFEYVIT
jgi:serine/threonine-protein kinase ULK/ATG1